MMIILGIALDFDRKQPSSLFSLSRVLHEAILVIDSDRGASEATFWEQASTTNSIFKKGENHEKNNHRNISNIVSKQLFFRRTAHAAANERSGAIWAVA